MIIESNESVCNGLLHNCRKCGYHYTSDQIEIVVCPECNEVRGRCKNVPEAGRERCKLHGGASPTGIQHYNYKGRGTSKHLPTKLLDSYEAVINDPDILNLTESIGLMESRRNELLVRERDAVDPASWKKMQKHMESYDMAIEVGNEKKADLELAELRTLIMRGYSEAWHWDEVKDLEERARKLRQTEMNRRKLAETVITESQFQTFLVFLMNSIQTWVKDDITKTKLMQDLAQWSGR